MIQLNRFIRRLCHHLPSRQGVSLAIHNNHCVVRQSERFHKSAPRIALTLSTPQTTTLFAPDTLPLPWYEAAAHNIYTTHQAPNQQTAQTLLKRDWREMLSPHCQNTIHSAIQQQAIDHIEPCWQTCLRLLQHYRQADHATVIYLNMGAQPHCYVMAQHQLCFALHGVALPTALAAYAASDTPAIIQTILTNDPRAANTVTSSGSFAHCIVKSDAVWAQWLARGVALTQRPLRHKAHSA